MQPAAGQIPIIWLLICYWPPIWRILQSKSGDILPLIDGIIHKRIFLYVTSPNNVKRTEHFVSWHTFRQNYKAGEGQLKNKAQQVHCQQHENGKAKYGLEAESPVNLSVLSDCACSDCNFVNIVFFQSTFNIPEPVFKNVRLRPLF